MSIAFSADLEARLSAMTEDERNRLVLSALNARQENMLEQTSTIDYDNLTLGEEEELMQIIPYPHKGPRFISREAMARIHALNSGAEEIPDEPTERMKQAFERYLTMTVEGQEILKRRKSE
jgi:hypothetical protein